MNTNKSVLDNRTVYLSGPIELDDAHKGDWRIPVKKVLINEFKLNVFDPFQDPKQNKRDSIHELRETEQWDKLYDTAHEFVRADLSVVDRADFLIAYLPYRIPTIGTHHEVINSNNAKKPTLLVCPEGKKRIGYWYFGFIKHHFMFGSWNDLYEYLREVNSFKHLENDRWYFTYHYFATNGCWEFIK